MHVSVQFCGQFCISPLFSSATERSMTCNDGEKAVLGFSVTSPWIYWPFKIPLQLNQRVSPEIAASNIYQTFYKSRHTSFSLISVINELAGNELREYHPTTTLWDLEMDIILPSKRAYIPPPIDPARARENHDHLIIGVTTTFILLAVIFASARFYVRIKTRQFKIDDYVLLFGMVSFWECKWK